MLSRSSSAGASSGVFCAVQISSPVDRRGRGGGGIQKKKKFEEATSNTKFKKKNLKKIQTFKTHPPPQCKSHHHDHLVSQLLDQCCNCFLSVLKPFLSFQAQTIDLILLHCVKIQSFEEETRGKEKLIRVVRFFTKLKNNKKK